MATNKVIERVVVIKKIEKAAVIKKIQKEINRTIEETHDEDGCPTDELSEGIIQGLELAISIINKIK